MTLRRVVVTGLGIVSPLGFGVDATWGNILASKSGAARVTDFEVDDLACQIACQIPYGDTSEGKYNPDDWMEPKEQRKVDPFIVYGMAAAGQAIQDSGLELKTEEQKERAGVLIGSGIGGLDYIAKTSIVLEERVLFDERVIHELLIQARRAQAEAVTQRRRPDLWARHTGSKHVAC